MAESSCHIVLVEAWYKSFGHVQFNRAFLSIVESAFADGRVTMACSADYRRDLESAGGVQIKLRNWIECDAWSHPGHTPGEFYRRTLWLADLIRRLRKGGEPATHLVVLGASGPIILALWAARWIAFARNCRTFTILHGGDEILRAWQPRNPFLRLFTFQSAIRRLPLVGVKAIAAESFIARGLQKLFPKQADNFCCIPMAFDEVEAAQPVDVVSSRQALRIVFVGQATPHKGFREFLRLADLAREAGNARLEFRAAGAVRADTKELDQSALTRRAGDAPIDRGELLAELRGADLVFSWQSDYYALSSSGVLLDCIGHDVPLVGRRSIAIAELEDRYGTCGLFADQVEALFDALSRLAVAPDRTERLKEWKSGLMHARAERTAAAIGPIARGILGP